MQIKRSSLLNIPRSPWKASEVWRKIEGVPNDAKVEVIFLPIFPDLPMPDITTVPLQSIIKSIHLEKFKLIFLDEAKMDISSASNTLFAYLILSVGLI